MFGRQSIKKGAGKKKKKKKGRGRKSWVIKMVPSLPLHPDANPSLPQVRSCESIVLSSLEFLSEVPVTGGK